MARSVTARAALAAGAVLLLVGAGTACGASASDDEDPDHRAFALTGTTLTVDSDDSALEIVATDAAPAGKVAVTRWFKGSVMFGSDPKATWSMKDGRLVLRARCSGVVADCAARHRIVVPRGVAVTVGSDDGSVRAQGFTRPLSVRTRDGSIDVSDSTGPLDLRSDDGSVRADGSSPRVAARTRDGSIDLRFAAVPDRVSADSDDGAVTVTLPHATYRVTTRTDDGSVDVSVPRDGHSAHTVTATTRDGRVTVRAAT
ncbi:DUF4097 family beta strand repeat-containing protein [Streptomyces sp. DSM 41014]|uniref:DUF4097 family beta strand repeat-containing protein n=1 Tax=Streptomyces hintoniae TaxID=3075521 RepID=A0ABU2UDC6_9ACTN|nr:DUF4097 family beta strand repeat-containing protein [Streptomyces sp. DSM 41014]MDT0471242.1 DUF4097 family beta strand repeat-containing protein [Streptomyces sp. DSM 41014]